MWGGDGESGKSCSRGTHRGLLMGALPGVGQWDSDEPERSTVDLLVIDMEESSTDARPDVEQWLH
jgi:hypothetical protein